MSGVIDRSVLRIRLCDILHANGLALTKDADEIEVPLDRMIDAVLDAIAQGAVSKGMDFARGLLAKRGGKEGGE